jgi:hypothetical protein
MLTAMEKCLAKGAEIILVTDDSFHHRVVPYLVSCSARTRPKAGRGWFELGYSG